MSWKPPGRLHRAPPRVAEIARSSMEARRVAAGKGRGDLPRNDQTREERIASARAALGRYHDGESETESAKLRRLRRQIQDARRAEEEADRARDLAISERDEARAIADRLQGQLREERARAERLLANLERVSRATDADVALGRLRIAAMGVPRDFDWLDFLERIGSGDAREDDPWDYFGELDPSTWRDDG